ncbi:MAG: transporter substrate-binding domain-containing protein, partial [Collinsella sp.]|nr:transporter substrate-binding domain-containing protein [Collinsella sp.]
FMQLESGAVDAVACDLSIAQYQLAAKPDAYTQLDKPLSSEHYAVGFKKGDTKSADAVTESLKALYEDGTVKDLCDKYASYGLSFDNWVLK